MSLHIGTPLCHTTNSRGEYSLFGYGPAAEPAEMSPVAAEEPVIDWAAIRAAATAAIQQRAAKRADEIRAEAAIKAAADAAAKEVAVAAATAAVQQRADKRAAEIEFAAAAAALPQLAVAIEMEAAAAALPQLEALIFTHQTFPLIPPTAERVAAAIAALNAGIQFF